MKIGNGNFNMESEEVRTIFVEAFFVTPLFLDICIEVFGAWINHKRISNSDIFKEDTAVFCKRWFFNTKLCHGETFIINLLS